MVLIILVTVSILAASLARLIPRWDAALAWLVGGVLAACAGLFTQGFDYEEYVNIIEATRQLSDADLALQLVSAKDPIFLFIIDAAGLWTDDVQLVFLIVAVLSVATKVLATKALPQQRTLFMALYAVFLAPGLEFAAIRAGLAIGLIMVGYTTIKRTRWRALWITLGLASHISVVFVVVGRLWPRWWRIMLVVVLVLVPIGGSALLGFLADDARYFQYLDNRGTPLAFLMPGGTLIAMLLLSRSARGRLPQHHAVLSKDSLVASQFVIAMSLILTLPVVTAATRVMELAWVFMLLQLLARDRLIHGRVLVFQAASWCMMIGVLTFADLLRGVWKILL